MNTIPHCDPKLLQDAIAGNLDQQTQDSVEFHLNSCQHCQSKLELLAGEQQDWEKVSDYFLADDLETDPFVCAPTVDIQLIKDSEDQEYKLTEPNHSPPNHSEILEPATHPEMLGRIDGFEIEQMIGQGGMGIVYKGFDTDLNRPVAIKVLADHLASNGVARQRFAREARAAAAVIHPNVVPIHSVNSSAKRPYLVMTLVSGRSLQAHVSKQGPLCVKDVVRIGKQIAAGLSAAHREGLVHRDIKPANILLEKDVSRVMITDFGLARAADDAAITQTGWLAGTPHYMSPEQATGKEIDQRSDLFSLGSVLYFMATGREPFRAEIPVAVLQKISSQQQEPVRSINSEASSTLANIIEKLMAKEPEHRFQSAESVESVLTQYLAHLEQPRTQPKPKIRLSQKNKSINRWVLRLAGISIIIMLTAWITMTVANWSSPRQDMSWPAGLQSPADWQFEFNELQKDIEAFETVAPNQPENQVLDPFTSEQMSIEATVLQLERNLGKTP